MANDLFLLGLLIATGGKIVGLAYFYLSENPNVGAIAALIASGYVMFIGAGLAGAVPPF